MSSMRGRLQKLIDSGTGILAGTPCTAYRFLIDLDSST
jgi:hypothetical protein